MWKFILVGILGLALVAIAVAITFPFLKEKISQKIVMRNVQKVVVADLEELAKNPSNGLSLNELRRTTEGKPTLVAVAVDKNSKIVGGTDVYKNDTYDLDEEVRELLGEQGEIVVNR